MNLNWNSIIHYEVSSRQWLPARWHDIRNTVFHFDVNYILYSSKKVGNFISRIHCNQISHKIRSRKLWNYTQIHLSELNLITWLSHLWMKNMFALFNRILLTCHKRNTWAGLKSKAEYLRCRSTITIWST